MAGVAGPFACDVPQLETSQLVEAFADIDINMNENDFQHASRDRWERIFVDILCTVTKCSQENLFQANIQSLPVLEYPEYHEKAIPLFYITKAMQRVFCSCGVSDFKMADIIHPKPKRLSRMCNALINFLRHKQEKYETFQRIMAEKEELVKKRKTLLKENEDLCREINAVTTKAVETEQKIKEEEDSLRKLSAEMQELQEETNDKNTQCTERYSQRNRAKGEHYKLEQNLQVAKEEGEKLAMAIVQSPERMNSEKNRMTSKLNQCGIERKAKTDRLIEYNDKRALLESRMNDIEQGLKFLNTVTEDQKKEKKVLEEISQMRNVTESRKEQCREIEINERQLRKQLLKLQGKQLKSSIQQNDKGAAVKKSIEVYKREMENLEKEKEDRIRSLTVEKRQLDRQDEEQPQEHEVYVKALEGRYFEIQHQVDLYHKKLGEGCEDFKAALKKRVPQNSE